MHSNLIKSLSIVSLVCVITACAGWDDEQVIEAAQQVNEPVTTETLCVSKIGNLIDCQQSKVVQQAEVEDEYEFETRSMQYTHPLEASNSTVLVGEYIEQMATDILKNLTIPLNDAVVGVTSFVEFSEDLSSVNHFGNMLAENFIFELQQNGIPVVDYKVAQGVTVTDDGDFVFSRNSTDLNLADSMSHVLTGTITYNRRGLVINARMVNFNSKRVVSASKKVIPYFVLDSIIPSSAKHTVTGE